MYILQVTRNGSTLGWVRYDPQRNRIVKDADIPDDIVADIEVTFHRDNVLFGGSGRGYFWREIAGPDACEWQI